MRSIAGILAIPVLALTVAADGLEQWPPRDYLVKSLVEGIPGILNAYDTDTGRFGSKPWICSDQNRIFALAAAWSIDHPDNPYYRSDEVLAAVAGGGRALVEAQDEDGRWRFDKKDGSYWGQTHMPWTYSRWIRAYHLVGDALSDDMRAIWERGLRLGFERIAAPYPNRGVHNIPVHHAMGLYIAGVVLENDDWRQRARDFMPKAVAAQDPTGFWSEHQGPVVAYNFVYSDALGIYYHYARDPIVLEALERTARFHASVLWPDGSSVSCIDERNLYSKRIRIGNPGFSHTPEGRGYLLAQLRRHAGDSGRLLAADMAAALLLYGGDGEVIMPEALGADGVVLLGGSDALIRRGDVWSWALSAYTAPVSRSRWIQDRHNLIDLFHADLGLVAGGGNTKLQPYWSTFTLGDTALLRHTPGDEKPDFTPEIDLAWVPERASASHHGDRSRLDALMAPRPIFNREILLSEGLEAAAAAELPRGWSLAFGQAGTVRVSSGEARQGSQALWFANDDARNSLGLRSPTLPAEPGIAYVAEAWWLGEPDHDARIYLEFWDAEEKRIDGSVGIFTCKGEGRWSKGGGSRRAPEGAVGVTMLLYSSVAAVTEGYFDDLTLGRLLPEDQGDRQAECSVDVHSEGDDLVLTYRGRPGVGVRAHLPLMLRGSRLELANGNSVPLVDDEVEIGGAETGGHLDHGNLRVTIPEKASVYWPARHHNPYTRDGRSGLNHARIVLVMPFDDTGEYSIRLSAIESEPFDGLVLEARDLPFEHSEGTYTKRLDSLGSQFIGNTGTGDWLRFTLPEIKPGRYELLGDFVLAHSYGIVEILFDGEVVGQPFDGYWTGVDSSGTMESFGIVQIDDGPHSVSIRIAGRNPEATNKLFSVRRWLFRPVD